MKQNAGTAGREAQKMAWRRLHGERPAPPGPFLPATTSPSPLMRQAVGTGSPEPRAKKVATSEIERETSLPSAQDVAERVYQILCETLNRERERLGYWD